MTVGYTFHAGDLFHVGHLHQLQECRKHCDELIVGVLSDEAIASYKRQPVIPYPWRKAIYAALRCVDRVVQQSLRDPTPNLQVLRPDVLFHGDDWDEIPGSQFMAKLGGRVIKTPYFKGISATEIIGSARQNRSIKFPMNEKTAVLILAAGPPRRGWKDKKPNCLAQVEGKPLIVRTLGQLKKLGFQATVVSHNEKIRKTVKGCFVPKVHGAWSETLMSTRALWADRTIVLHGDVIFSEKLLQKILGEQRLLQFHGRPGSAFAVVFKRDAHPEIITALEIAIADYKVRTLARDNGLIWQFYRALCGFPLHPENHRGDRLYTLSKAGEYPKDLDSVADYEQFLRDYPWAAEVQLMSS